MRLSLAARIVHIAVCLSIVPTLTRAQAPAPDNTKVNTRDRTPAQPTADRQSNTRTDVSITRDIRRAIVKDKALSTAAHNIKIITQQGQVTLKGPVRSDAEKQAIEAKATEIAGAGHVTSDVSVKDPSAPVAKPRPKRKA
jgi:hyperosmotically inducible periplasmic protein